MIVRRMKPIVETNEVGCDGMSVMVTPAFASSLVTSLSGMFLWPGTQMRVVGPFLLSSR